MGFFSFIVLLAIAYLIWRVTDQLPDLIFRLSEIQRDVAEVRRRLADQDQAAGAGTGAGTGASGSAGSPPPASRPVLGDESGADHSGS